MLNQIFAKIESLISNTNAKTTALLKPILSPLADIDPQLAADCMAFILNGEHAEVLMQLQQLPDDKACALLGKPGTYRNYWSQSSISKAQEKLAIASTKARKELYESLFDLLQMEQIIRYGKVLAAATQQRNFTYLYPDLPQWFHYVTIDGLISSLSDLGFSERDHSKAMRQHWSLAQLEQLLEADEAGQGSHLLAFLFERQNTPSYCSDEFDLLFKLSDSHSYIVSHLEKLQQVIPSLSIDAQIGFLEYLKLNSEVLKQIPQLLVQLAVSKSKKVRESGTSLITELSSAQSQAHLSHYLQHGLSIERSYSAELLARLGQDNLAILEQAYATETQKSVQHAIRTAMQRLESVNSAEIQCDIEIPELSTLPATQIPESFTAVILENYQLVLQKAEQSAAVETEENKTREYKYHWSNKNLKNLQKVKPESLARVVAFLNAESTLKGFENDQNIISFQNKLKNLPEYSLRHALRLMSLNGRNHIYWPSLFTQLKAEHYTQLELRHYVHALAHSNFEQPSRMVAKSMLSDGWNSLADYVDGGDKIWPFFAENIEYLSEALGLSPSLEKNQYQQFDAGRAIQILHYFPSLPQQFIPRLLEFALGENKSLRFDAQQALHTLPDIQQRAIEALESGKQEIRITAIEWLARLQHADAVPALNKLLLKEKKEVVRAALLTALEKLGQDIQAYLTPAVLLKEAEQGLKGRLSASLSWFRFSDVPALKWQNGKTLNPSIIQWWIILVEKLKDPKANELIQRYVGLLDAKSQQLLANHILHTFIHQDTLGPTLEDVSIIALKEAPARLKNYQDWSKRHPEYYPEYANATLESVTEEMKRQLLATYLGSAIKSKGLLALTSAAQGSFAVKQLQDFMKLHYQRRAQVEAMISALSISNDPLIIQLLLGLSRRYRTASVQALANTLVSEIAERNQWSSDELADRTIPTAGLDEQGILHLDFGTRQFTAYVDDKDKLVLKNEDGKVIKALPAARQTDDESLIKEAKILFSSSKKELKQVIDLQTQRLYEAMCSQRQWSLDEWQAYIYAHPIMRRLIQRMIWLEITEDGQQQHFRPSDDGSLLNLDDDEIELQRNSKIQISHAVFVNKDEAEQWIEHFKDYKVKFLFAQMTNHLPKLENIKATEIADRQGWLTDTFTLRGVLNKLGYQRTSIEDAGSFDCYSKSFSQLGLHVHISFSGSYVPEENIPAVLYHLSFERQSRRSWSQDTLGLDEIPEILLAESYADYLKVAEACSGFDPEWQKKTPW